MVSAAHDLTSPFEFVRSKNIANLNLEVEEYRHRTTGAQHFHFVSEHPENVFMVAFRTVPNDSTGVAHILEHTTLCGSERYPVRDPFFLMIRRSLNTFMNAFTASDYTAYPFASENKRDFQNLLGIYLDAVFFPLLDPLDFAQEGHRLEFSEADNPASELEYKGVVYNEMKGDQSSVISQLFEAVKAEVFPTSTYHHNSGGDPKEIPNLSYEQLVAFHRRHYHPSNAIFMTFGDTPAAEHQTYIHEQALVRFAAANDEVIVASEIPLDAPKQVARPYPVKEAKDNQSHVLMAWKLGVNTDLEALIKCNLLSDVLLDTSASPLRFVLENTALAAAPSPLCGLEESNYEISFFCGVEGANGADAEQIQTLILTTLEDVVKRGVEVSQIEACLHQLELSHREIGGDGYPYGLQLMFSCLAAAIHRSDPIALLELDTVIEKIRAEIHDPDFIPGLIQKYLLNNTHRVLFTFYPDEKFSDREQAELKSVLARKQASLDGEQAELIIEQTRALQQRQAREEPLHLLPKVGVNDIGEPKQRPKAAKSQQGDVGLTEYVVGTNGISYEQVVCDLPNLNLEQQGLLQVYSQVITEIGAAGRDYLETQGLQHSKTGGLGCYSVLRGRRDNPDQLLAKFIMSSRCLTRNLDDMNQILSETYFEPNFAEKNRIKDLVHQLRLRRDGSVTNNGHSLVMTAAAAFFRPVAAFNHQVSGLSGLLRLRQLDDGLEQSQQLATLVNELQEINEALSEQQKQLLLISEKPLANTSTIAKLWRGSNQSCLANEALMPEVPQHQAWLTTTQVNHCAEVFATVPEEHEDAPALAVLAGVLRNGFLHRVLREQGGAYGGGATADQSNGLFRFYSYRDPNLEQTFTAFRESIEWLQRSDIHFDLIEEAILGIVSSLDAPGSPAGEARTHFQQQLLGRSSEHRELFRSRVIATKVDDVKRVAATYFDRPSATAVMTNHDRQLDGKYELFNL